MNGASLYILRCKDGKLYTGLTKREVEERVSEHAQGLADFTRRRRPVELLFSEHYEIILDAIAAERRIKRWTRAKKLAYVAGDFELLWHGGGGRHGSRGGIEADELLVRDAAARLLTMRVVGAARVCLVPLIIRAASPDPSW